MRKGRIDKMADWKKEKREGKDKKMGTEKIGKGERDEGVGERVRREMRGWMTHCRWESR